MSVVPPEVLLDSVAPKAGAYPIVAGKLVAPSSRSMLGYGPMQFCGVFDTRPELKAWQNEVDRALQPAPYAGGATLRWMAPRNSQPNSVSAVQTLNPAFADAIALTLYVGGLDVLPPPNNWAQAGWPGRPVGTRPFVFSKGGATLPAVWQNGLAFTRPVQVNQSIASGAAGQYGLAEMQDGFGWMRLFGAMPALDLLSYAGAPWSEADLGELAGGTRYVAAWLRLWWARREGVNMLADVNYYVPWTVSPGPAKRPAHRGCWHCAYPVLPIEGVATAADVYDNGVRLGVSSPNSGTWRVGAENNGDALDNPVFVGLELRGSTILSRANMSVGPTNHGSIIGPSNVHGGSGVISAGFPSGGEQDAILISVAVAGVT